MSLHHSPKIVTNGLVLCLDAANRKSYSGSGTVWKDLSERNNNGTLVNGPIFSTINGGGIIFDNVDDQVNCGNNSSLSLTNNFTLETWFNARSFGENNLGRFFDKTSGGNGFMFSLDNSNVSNGMQFFVNSAGVLFAANSILLNTNYHVTLVVNNNVAFMYRNNVLLGISSSFNIVNAATNLQIGNRAGADRTFDGTIYCAKVYNRVLSATEILQNYNALKGRFNL